jgi:uncharacterized membrane protein YfcA
MVIMTGQRWFDSLAIGASALCLVHCLILPLVLVLVPTLAVFLAIPESFHLGVFLVAIPSSAVALTMGYGRHRRRVPMLLAVAGLACLAAGLFAAPSERAETLLTIVGSCLLAFGHVQNWRGMRHRHRWSGR